MAFSSAAPAWSVAEVGRVLTRYGRPGDPGRLAVRPLAGGKANLNLRVATGDEALVLRRYATAAAPEAVRWELELVRFLTARAFPTAPVLATPAGELAVPFAGGVAALFRFVAGVHPAPESLPAAEAVTAAVAGLHRLTAGAPLPYPRSAPPADSARRLAWLAALDLTPYGDPELGVLQRDVRAFRRALAARLGRRRAGLPGGVVHHDAHAGNVLLDAAGRLAALLDFDDAHPGLLLTDLANLLWYWAAPWSDPRLDLARAAHLVARYHHARPLVAAEREVLPDLVARRLLARALADVRRALRLAPAAPVVGALPALRRYRDLTAPPDWRRELGSALLADAGASGGA